MPPIAILSDDHSTDSTFNVKDTLLKFQSPKISRVSRVDFHDHHIVHEVEEIELEHRTDFWYSKEEFEIIRSSNSLIVKMKKAGSFEETEEHTFRGLEHKLKAGFKQRRDNKFNALNAVLYEQDQQYHHGNNDPEAIAEAYRLVSMSAKEFACMLACNDAEDSYAHVAATTPSRTDSDLQEPATYEDDVSIVDYETDGDTIHSESSITSKKKSRLHRFFRKTNKNKVLPYPNMVDGKVSRRLNL